MKPEYLMLGHTFKPVKHNIAGWFLSEKLDGIRAWWDGGLSRGVKASDVPYANKIKDYRLKDEPIATGLWSRTGKVIHAPDYWLDDLPHWPLDGELWLEHGCFQELTSIVSRLEGSIRWDRVKYCVFDSPPYYIALRNRTVKVRDYSFNIYAAIDWYWYRLGCLDFTIKSVSSKWTFETVLLWLKNRESGLGPRVILVDQERLPFHHFEAVEIVNQRLKELLMIGGEGVMLRKHSSFWLPQRCHTLLKYKPWKDDEAIVTGFTTGRETDRGSKLLGMIGALIVDYNGKRLELSGLTDEERRFTQYWMRRWAEDNPGKDVPIEDPFEGTHFSIGDTITFKYRELSDDGVPKEARYYRKRGQE